MDEFNEQHLLNMSFNSCPYLLRKTKDERTHIMLLYIINLIVFYFWELQRTIDQKKAVHFSLHWVTLVQLISLPSSENSGG